MAQEILKNEHLQKSVAKQKSTIRDLKDSIKKIKKKKKNNPEDPGTDVCGKGDVSILSSSTGVEDKHSNACKCLFSVIIFFKYLRDWCKFWYFQHL